MNDPIKIEYTAEATVEGGREGHGRTADGCGLPAGANST
jgi:hypothetical protein